MLKRVSFGRKFAALIVAVTVLACGFAFSSSASAAEDAEGFSYEQAQQIIELSESISEDSTVAYAPSLLEGAAEINAAAVSAAVADSGDDVAAAAQAVVDEASAVVRDEEVPMFATFWALVPPLIAIALALITKEVYLSLFIGIVTGALFYSNFHPIKTLESIFSVMTEYTGDSWNMGILIFLVILGIIVCLVTEAGGSAAYGNWAAKKIKSRTGAILSTFVLGVVIFIDDYFNCLTVGSVMRPVTDKFKVSRAKLAYIIDATAAPVCIIAPISSWAAAVSSYAAEGEGLTLFVKTIPYNFYALLTIVMVIAITLMKFDFGPMKLHEKNAIDKGDLFTSGTIAPVSEDKTNNKGKVIDLVLPVVVLIICCIIGMIYTGGFFDGESFINAFSNCDASVGLVLGSFVALLFTFLLYIPRKVIKVKTFFSAIPEGFKAMVPSIIILIFAWTLGGFCKSYLGAGDFVANLIAGSSMSFSLLPAIMFAVSLGLAFSTGTSWGTFGILIPIALDIFDKASITGDITIIAIAACLAGAVCGDHCSPISDTTIMASSGAQCDHINHVSTQLPYAMTVAAVSFVSFIIAAFVKSAFIALPIGIVLMLATVFVIKAVTGKSKAKQK